MLLYSLKRYNLDMEKVTISKEEYEQLLKLNETVKSLQTYVLELESTVNFLKEHLNVSKAHRFGSSSEKNVNLKQMSFDLLFNESEVLADSSLPEPNLATITTVKEHQRSKKNSLKVSLPESIPVIEFHHSEILEGSTCPHCQHELVKFGTKEHDHLVLAPARAVLVKDITDIYKCEHCENTGEKAVIKEADYPPSVIPGSLASAEAIAQIANEKFVQGTPLYRQEKYWGRFGVNLTRQTMSNWLLYAVSHHLEPIYNNLCQQILKHEVLHTDETVLQVLHEEGKSPQSKSYMWLYRTSGDSENAIVIYQYERDRKQIRPQTFLEPFQGYLHCDGYTAYHNLPASITYIGCWAHMKRRLVDAKKALSKNAPVNNLIEEMLNYVEQLFMYEKSLKDKPPDERYEKRLLYEKPIAETFFKRMAEIDVSEKSYFGKARHYALGQKKYLMNFFLDSRLELSNNRAERSIKPFVISRKNFLFANTPKGASGSAIYFSLVETCKENGIDPYAYLVFALKQSAYLQTKGKPEKIADLTPDYFKKHNNSN